jgi:putative membrane protein
MALPARETAVAALGERAARRPARTALGAAALTGWDLFLDPQMVGEGYWTWVRRGHYRGIPFANFAGWFATGLGVMALLDALLPSTGQVTTDGPLGHHTGDGALIGEYTFVAVMETLGFARFFRDPLVAAVGGAAMLPVAVTAVVRKLA